MGLQFPFSRRLQCGHALLILGCLIPIAQAQTKPPPPADRGNSVQVSRQVDDLRKELLALRHEIETLKIKLSVDKFLQAGWSILSPL